MQVETVIAHTITDDIRQKGHQSIRLTADGFSVLVADASFIPVYLKDFIFDAPVAGHIVAEECRRILREQGLTRFDGEIILISDSQAATLVPDRFFDEEQKDLLLGSVNEIREDDLILSRRLKNRSEHIIYSVPPYIHKLSELYQREVRILHTGECMVSLSDQVSASLHQRGFVLIEVQKKKMEILIIRGDTIILSNRYLLNEPFDYLYHTLNTFKQLQLDREKVPLYFAGQYDEEQEPDRLMKKYIRKIAPVPYFLEGLTKRQKLQFLILSEATRCA
ncbi:MAG: DUF3822 family protein [Bacteroidales bacterium]|nr:DUF3822 family protein [Bacteroidales bacterium]